MDLRGAILVGLGSMESAIAPLGHVGHGSALMFVAYTGYGRIATLGEEVHQPRRTIPIAIILTISVICIGVAIAALVLIGNVKTTWSFSNSVQR